MTCTIYIAWKEHVHLSRNAIKSSMLDNLSLYHFIIGFAAFLIVNYLVFSVLGHWFFYKYLGPTIPHRLINEKMGSDEQLKVEKRRAISTQIVFFVMGVGLFALYQTGVTRIYTRWDENGVIYFFASWFLIQHLHDAYFYWTHRLMHEWNWLRKYHFAHHESTTPTPYAALSSWFLLVYNRLFISCSGPLDVWLL
jgi:sterol desaturase/sphingolipid hydroxylase (fatty acid hydroxylase superfamily)